MFRYSPPKGSCWGHAIRGRDLRSATEHLHKFFADYFEPIVRNGDAHDFSCTLKWKDGVLPRDGLTVELLQLPAGLCGVTLGGGSRIAFLGGLIIPISPTEQSSYEFIRRFAGDAPFKMSAKHFSLWRPPLGKGTLRWKKAEGEVLARLQAVI